MQRTVNDIKPYYADSITDALRSVGFTAGIDAHPEFQRAVQSVAVAFGITTHELRNGTTRTGRLNWKEDIIAVLKSILSAAGRDAHPEFTRAIDSIALQFGISKQEL